MDFSVGSREARISDLSMGGCFVDSIAGVAVGEIMSLIVGVSPERTTKLCGEVVYVYPNSGFGLRFINLTDFDKSILKEIILVNGGNPWNQGSVAPKEDVPAEETGLDRETETASAGEKSFEDIKKSIQEGLE
jgi:hypothetical protein